MAIESFVLTQDFKSPYVVATGRADKPQQIKAKHFQKGEVVQGELKHANNKPAFVLVQGTLVIPIDAIKKVVAEDIKTSNADGDPKGEITVQKVEHLDINSNPKIKYIDAMIVGSLVGASAVYGVEKKTTWLPPDKMNKVYGAIVGALAGWYFVYRNKGTQPISKIKKD